jgi:zinc protease
VIPDEAKLAAVIKGASAKDLKAYADTVGAVALLESIPAPGTITRTSAKDAIGITEWELSNGVKVILKPTTARADEILFRATSPGGTSLASDKDYIPASSATQVIGAGGLGKMNAIDLQKMLAGKVVSVNPYIGELEEGLSGNSSRRDLETLFQLIYLTFTQPRADPTAFGVQAAQMKARFANQSSVPEYIFFETLVNALYQNHVRKRLPAAATVDDWNLEKSLGFYKERFADASDFTFVFVGSFDLATMKPLVERYLGALPSIRRKETWKDIGARMATGVVEKKVEKGIEPKSLAAIVFGGPFEGDQKHRVALRAMAEVLQMRLMETIREELGGAYSVTVGQTAQRIPNLEYSVFIQFGSDPQRTDDLIKRVFQEIEQLKTKGPTEAQVKAEKEALVREFETRSGLNSYLLDQILEKYQYGEDLTDLMNLREYYRKIDAAMIQDAARTYLNPKNYVKVTLVPEKK